MVLFSLLFHIIDSKKIYVQTSGEGQGIGGNNKALKLSIMCISQLVIYFLIFLLFYRWHFSIVNNKIEYGIVLSFVNNVTQSIFIHIYYDVFPNSDWYVMFYQKRLICYI